MGLLPNPKKGSLGTGQRFHYQLYTFNLKYNTRSRKHRYLSNSADKGTKHALSNLACPQGSVPVPRAPVPQGSRPRAPQGSQRHIIRIQPFFMSYLFSFAGNKCCSFFSMSSGILVPLASTNPRDFIFKSSRAVPPAIRVEFAVSHSNSSKLDSSTPL